MSDRPQFVPSIGDKVYLVQVCGGSASIIAGHVEELLAIIAGSKNPDAARVRYAPGSIHDTDTEWLSDLSPSEEAARDLMTQKIAQSIASMRDAIASLESVNTATVSIFDKTGKP